MVLEFNVKEFLQNLKATKPPYECPFENCGKLYKSYLGIRFHLYNFDHVTGTQTVDTDTPDGNKARKRGMWHHRQNLGRSPSPPDFLRGSTREALTYAEAQKMVEFDIDGHIHRINICEPLDIVFVDGKNGEIVPDVSSDKLQCSVASHQNHSVVKPTKGGKQSKPNKIVGKQKKETGNDCDAAKAQQPTSPPKLPEPSFRVIDDYEPPDTAPRSSSYYRFIEKSPEEIDEEIEYDMDEEDNAWLDIINSKRTNDNLPTVSADAFELLMDRFEKESYFQSQSSGKDMGPAIDEDAVCCICNDGECQNSNAILFCDMCNLAVHQECYGVPYIPEGQWLCRRCLQSPSRAVDCVLCPNKGGAFKQTDDNRWAHVVCALWIPEVCFANTVFLEPIDSITNIPSARWKLSCYICKQRSVGACIQCHKANCYVAFHVTCAQQAGLYMKMEAVKEMTSSGLITNVRKAAYCDAHTPAAESGTGLSGVYSSGEEDSRSEFRRMQQTKAKFKEKMKRARKILAEKRSAIPVVSVPTIPLDRLTKIAATINIPKRNQFIQRLLGYWTLKRQSRNGVPLLRRLQISHTGMRRGDLKDDDDEQAAKLREQLKALQRLRQDLEKARLLIELIRKREKLKRELVRYHQVVIETNLNAFNSFLKHVLSLVQEKDNKKFFANPVDTTEVPDYLDFIQQPMDFSTMRGKIETHQYQSLESFEEDIDLIIRNCLFYNEKDTVYHKHALKLREQSAVILKEAKKQIQTTGFNQAAGLLDPLTNFSFDFVKDLPVISHDEQLQHQQSRLKGLEDSLKKAMQTKSGGSRTKRVRSLQAEIANLKREINLFTFAPKSVSNISKSEPLSVGTNKRQKTGRKSSARNLLIGGNSDSEATDICGNDQNDTTINFTPFLASTEGRRTQNSVSASINSQTLSPAVSLRNSQTSLKESPKRNQTRSSRGNRGKKKSSAQTKNNGEDSRPAINCRPNKRLPNKLFLNSPAVSSISPISSISSVSCKSHPLNKSPAPKSLRNQMENKPTDVNSTMNMFTLTAESFAKEQEGKQIGPKRRMDRNNSRPVKKQATNLPTIDSSFASVAIPQSDSFKVYRSSLNSSSDSDAKSESSHSLVSESSHSGSTSEVSGTSRSQSPSSALSTESKGSSAALRNGRRKSPRRPLSRSSRSDVSVDNNRIGLPLQPLDLVWAKFRGYPWYPALIVNPDASKTGMSNGDVLIPVPPEDVIKHREIQEDKPVYLVLFFDTKRTWQWLPRNKLEPLGVDQTFDQAKLREPRKQGDKKAVKKAYEKAILHRARVTGEANDCSGESSGSD